MEATRLLAAALSFLAASPALAHPALHVDPKLDDCEVHFAPELTQGAFERFAREFGSVSAFKQGSGPTTLGTQGAAADLEQIYFRVDEDAPAWNDTFRHPAADHWLGADKAFPKLRLRYGATDALDVGVFFTKSPEANYGWLGVEGKVGLLAQREGAPVSLSVRGAYTKTLWVGDMNMHALTADVSVGRTFWTHVTPYLTVGADAVLARETSVAVDLKDEALFVPHATAGLEVRFWHVSLDAEYQVAALPSFQVQVSAVF
jgi:opacity protein-like surface antigen